MKITKEEISQTAVQLFLDKGYNNVTIQDICNELHITKPTLYKYVNNKEELILDLYDSTIDHLVKDTYKLVDSDSHYQQLLIVFSTLIKDTKKSPSSEMGMLSELGGFGSMGTNSIENEIEQEDTSIPAISTVKNYSYAIVDDKLYFRENSKNEFPGISRGFNRRF